MLLGIESIFEPIILIHFGVDLGFLLLIRQPQREVWNCSGHLNYEREHKYVNECSVEEKAIILDCFPFCGTEHQEETLLFSSCSLTPSRAGAPWQSIATRMFTHSSTPYSGILQYKVHETCSSYLICNLISEGTALEP